MWKLKAIWNLLTSSNWLVVTSKTGKPKDKMNICGAYSVAMAETTINHMIAQVNDAVDQENAVSEVKNIINGIN
jgi:hypothetical protein